MSGLSRWLPLVFRNRLEYWCASNRPRAWEMDNLKRVVWLAIADQEYWDTLGRGPRPGEILSDAYSVSCKTCSIPTSNDHSIPQPPPAESI